MHRIKSFRPRATLTRQIGVLFASGMASGQLCAALPVTNCNSSGPGSLRSAIETANPPDADIIDLRRLSCGKISLDDGAITVRQNTLQIFGPRNDLLTIEGKGDRLFNHVGTQGPLYITDVTLENGISHDKGGCIASAAEVDLLRTVITGCHVDVDARLTSPAIGGAVYAQNRIVLVDSLVTGNSIRGADVDVAYGGAIAAPWNVTAKYSTISDNSVVSLSRRGYGGGIFAGGLYLKGTTLSHNLSDYGGGVWLENYPGYSQALIRNSTISGNEATGAAAIFAEHAIEISSSTIAANRDSSSMAATYTIATLALYNDIFAGNASLSTAAEADIGANCGICSSVITGSHNLIVASSVPVPADTVPSCPRLGPLAENGGTTLTHMIPATSPAVDAGGVPSSSYDQRTLPRLINTLLDIGAVERNANDKDDRILRSGLELVCD